MRVKILCLLKRIELLFLGSGKGHNYIKGSCVFMSTTIKDGTGIWHIYCCHIKKHYFFTDITMPSSIYIQKSHTFIHFKLIKSAHTLMQYAKFKAL